MIEKSMTYSIKYPGIYYASGHAHTLQYFYTKDSIHYIISGAGSKEKMLRKKILKNIISHLLPMNTYYGIPAGFLKWTFWEKQRIQLLYYEKAQRNAY